MADSTIKINPFNILNIREVPVPAPHFEYIFLDHKLYNTRNIRMWILENLKNRFFINESLMIENNQYTIKVKIGFESHAEASFFLLACPHLSH